MADSRNLYLYVALAVGVEMALCIFIGGVLSTATLYGEPSLTASTLRYLGSQVVEASVCLGVLASLASARGEHFFMPLYLLYNSIDVTLMVFNYLPISAEASIPASIVSTT